MKKLGWRASDTRELSFEDVRVPEDNLLGERGGGFQQFLEILDGGRISVAAMGVGLAQGAYDLAYRLRKGARAVRQADLVLPGDPVQARGHGHRDRGRPGDGLQGGVAQGSGPSFAREAAMAKLYTGELSNRVVDAALQIHGGFGYMEESAISRFYRDQKILEIGEGTNEVQRMVIARLLGL